MSGNQHLDQINKAYMGGMGEKFQKKTRSRLHWALKKLAGEDVLDIGCSQGIFGILAAREGFCVTAIDVNEGAINSANEMLLKETYSVQQQIKFQCLDVFSSNINEYLNKKYDSLVLGEFLEHFSQPERALKASIIHLKEDGKLIITTPFGYYPHEDHFSSFFPSDLVEMFDRNFLEVEEFQVVDGVFRVVAKKKALDDFDKNTINIISVTNEATYRSQYNLREEITELYSKNEKYKYLEKELKHNNSQISELKKVVVVKEKEFNELKKVVVVKEKEFNELKKVVVVKEKEFNELKKVVVVKEKEFNELKANFNKYKEIINKNYKLKFSPVNKIKSFIWSIDPRISKFLSLGKKLFTKTCSNPKYFFKLVKQLSENPKYFYSRLNHHLKAMESNIEDRLDPAKVVKFNGEKNIHSVTFDDFIEDCKVNANKKIIIINGISKPYDEANGINYGSTYLADAMAENGHAVIMLWYMAKDINRIEIRESGAIFLPKQFVITNKSMFKFSELNNHKFYISCLCDADAVQLSNYFKLFDWKTAYQIYDDWAEFKKKGIANYYRENIEKQIVNSVDKVFVVSPPLYRKAVQFGSKELEIHYLNNGVPNSFISDAKNICEANLDKNVEENIAGYWGQLSNAFFDWNAVIILAKKFPNWRFEMIGPNVPDSMKLPKNIVILGIVEHSKLVDYAQNWSIGLITFKLSALERAVDPIKVYEYLACGLKVVSCEMEQTINYPIVWSYKTYKELPDVFSNAAKHVVDKNEKGRILSFVQASSWESRANCMINLLEN